MEASVFLFVGWAFFIQLVLNAYFALRKWRFATAMRIGWVVYALCIPALVLSFLFWQQGKPWGFWVGGVIYILWAAFGTLVEYRFKIQWRVPIRLPVAIPYLTLYLGTMLFYWFPLANIWKPLWYIYAVLFVTSSWLNITSHKPESMAPSSVPGQGSA